jgi:hypothetical protein
VARAREIAFHCRKMAAIRNPREFGEKVTQEVTGAGGESLNLVVTFVAPEPRQLVDKFIETECLSII